MIKQFIFCGSLGWCFEVFWTGLGSLFHHDKKLIGRTSLHMFPIYGTAVIIPPIHKLIKKANVFIRGSVYALCIFLTEFISGSFLKKHNACPWDYSGSVFNYKGIIRLDYAPVWFIVGLIYEKFLCASDSEASLPSALRFLSNVKRAAWFGVPFLIYFLKVLSIKFLALIG